MKMSLIINHLKKNAIFDERTNLLKVQNDFDDDIKDDI